MFDLNTPVSVLQISVYRVVSKELSLRGQLAARGNLPEKGYDFYLSLVQCERFSQEIPTAPLGPRNDILNPLVINCALNSQFPTVYHEASGGARKIVFDKKWLLFPASFAIIPPQSMQGSYIGNTTASQAVKAGSIPVPCSRKETPFVRRQKVFLFNEINPLRDL